MTTHHWLLLLPLDMHLLILADMTLWDLFHMKLVCRDWWAVVRTYQRQRPRDWASKFGWYDCPVDPRSVNRIVDMLMDNKLPRKIIAGVLSVSPCTPSICLWPKGFCLSMCQVTGRDPDIYLPRMLHNAMPDACFQQDSAVSVTRLLKRLGKPPLHIYIAQPADQKCAHRLTVTWHTEDTVSITLDRLDWISSAAFRTTCLLKPVPMPIPYFTMGHLIHLAVQHVEKNIHMRRHLTPQYYNNQLLFWHYRLLSIIEESM